MSVSQRDPSMVMPSVDACANIFYFIFPYLHFHTLRTNVSVRVFVPKEDMSAFNLTKDTRMLTLSFLML